MINAKFVYDVANASDQAELLQILRWSFRRDEKDIEQWIGRAGLDATRVARCEGRAVASLLLVDAGQFFGGRSVPIAAIAAVATAPEMRGGGIGRTLLGGALDELAARGIGVATLFPSTRVVYRKIGFEPAGVRLSYRARLVDFPIHDDLPASRPAISADEASIAALYREQMIPWNGPLDRSPYFWGRVREHHVHLIRGFVFEAAGELEAYLHAFELPSSHPDDGFRYELRLTDLAARSEAGLRAVMGFLASHRSLATHVTWDGGPGDPLIQMFPGAEYSVSQSPSHWMVRIVDVRRALEARGYPPGPPTALGLEIVDPILSHNDACFTLEVANGRARVTKGGRSDLRLPISGLAALYTSHVPPAILRAMGRLQGSDEAVQRAATLFGGPAPWMRDAF